MLCHVWACSHGARPQFIKPSWVGMEEGAEECACQFDPEKKKKYKGQGLGERGWAEETRVMTCLRSWALWLVSLCSSLCSGCWCACGCVSSWTGPCQRPRRTAAPTPSRQTRHRRPPRLPSLSEPFALSPSVLWAGDTQTQSVGLHLVYIQILMVESAGGEEVKVCSWTTMLTVCVSLGTETTFFPQPTLLQHDHYVLWEGNLQPPRLRQGTRLCCPKALVMFEDGNGEPVRAEN